MHYKEIIKFKEDAYSKKISRTLYTLRILRANIFRKRGRINICAMSLGVSLGVAIPSHGASLVSAAYNARNMYVQLKKLLLLEAEWVHRGEIKLCQRKRDVLMPLCIGIATAGVGIGIAEGMAVAGAVNVDVASHHAADIISDNVGTLLHHLSDVGSGAVHGFREAFITLGTAGHANLQNAAADATMNAANFAVLMPAADAQALGLAIGMQGAESVVKLAAGQALDMGGEGVRNRTPRERKTGS